ncbi:hypothetical protein J132_01122 [Termitomyces sp. J132]|nr:hypothetical protein J132_01122 [Termitomyces sp. J132]
MKLPKGLGRRGKEELALCVASSGIAALLLKSSRAAHSRFKTSHCICLPCLLLKASPFIINNTTYTSQLPMSKLSMIKYSEWENQCSDALYQLAVHVLQPAKESKDDESLTDLCTQVEGAMQHIHTLCPQPVVSPDGTVKIMYTIKILDNKLSIIAMICMLPCEEYVAFISSILMLSSLMKEAVLEAFQIKPKRCNARLVKWKLLLLWQLHIQLPVFSVMDHTEFKTAQASRWYACKPKRMMVLINPRNPMGSQCGVKAETKPRSQSQCSCL